jgi:hypothetical protein
MESVVFEGKEYIKASVLAERFCYTQDYLGQLCRGRKVDARLVGRAWYINLDSLQNHRSTRYKQEGIQFAEVKVESAPVTAKKPSNHYLSRIDVEPVLRQKTVKILKSEERKLKEVPVRYEVDDFSLIPKVNKEAINKTLPIIPAQAESVRVREPKKTIKITKFKAEPLPEVFLRGKLTVAGIPEEIHGAPKLSAIPEDIEEKKETTLPEATAVAVKLEKPAQKEPIAVVKRTLKPLKIKLLAGRKTAVPVHAEKTPPAPVMSLKGPRDRAVLKNPLQQPVAPVKPVSSGQFVPKSVAAIAVTNPKTTAAEKEPTIPPTLEAILLLVLGFGVAFVVLSASTTVSATTNSFDSITAFSLENVKVIFSNIEVKIGW